MEGGSHLLYGEAHIQGVRGDYLKAPFYYNTTRETQPYHFTSWMVPATILYQVALCGSSMPLVDLIQAVHQQPRWRPCSPTQVNGLKLGPYWGADTTVDIMVPLDTMATILQGLSQEHENLEDAIRCLQDLSVNSTMSGLCHSSIASDFPQIGRCGFPQDEVNKKFSLKATHPKYYDINTPEGLAFMSQVAAADAFFKNPPVGSGLSSPTPPATFWLKVKKVGEFFGYLGTKGGTCPQEE